MDKLHASGCIFLSIDTGRVLLQQRSEKSSHPRTWGFFGGKGEEGERPLAVAVFEEFIPQLNNESDGFCWVKINNWPRPLHPGTKAQLYNKEIVKKIRTIHQTSSINGSNWLDTL